MRALRWNRAAGGTLRPLETCSTVCLQSIVTLKSTEGMKVLMLQANVKLSMK